MKSIVSLFAFVIFLSTSLTAQELSLEGTIFAYQSEPRFTDKDYFLGAVGQVGLAYSDTLNTKWDYKIGVAYMGRTESYSSVGTAFVFDGLGDSLQVSTKIEDRYDSGYVSLNLGLRYWFRAPRKGFYIQTELMPHFLVTSERRESEFSDPVEEYNRFSEITRSDASLHSFNVSWLNSIGFKVPLIWGLGFHFSFNIITNFGPVVKGVTDSLRFGRSITFGADYRL